MKTLKLALFTILSAASALAQTPTYSLILKNDALVDATHYEFEIWMERTGGVVFELASLQPIMTFNTGISAGVLTLSMNSGTSDLDADQEPTVMSVTGNELRVNPRVPPGPGAGTIIPVSPGLRVGRFRITSTTAFTSQQADIAWKNNTNPFTKVFAYDVSDINIEITESTGHLNSLANPSLSPLFITSASPRPAATADVLYRDTLRASGGELPLTWSVIAGALPSGITLSSAGIISGTATVTGTSNFTARVVDNASAADTAAYSLTVNPGTAEQLAFVQQPTDEIAGVFIAPAVTVRLTDNVGNTVPTAGVEVTMNLTSGNGTLTGSLTETTNASGIATFDNLKIDRKGLKVITASSIITSSMASATFEILAADAALIRIETAADGSGILVPAQSHTPLSGLTVYAISRDAFDNFIENIAANSWTLQGVTGGVVGGDLVPAGDSRSATFTGHMVGSAQIRATSPSLTPVNSGTITVIAGSAKKLAFIQQPSNGISAAVISPPVTVQVRDTANNAVAAENVSVSMTLSSGTGTLGGDMTQLTNAAGLATFGDLSVNTSGVKALTAAAPGLTSAVSNNFTLSTYIITASAGSNGTITPSGAIEVNSGADQAFSIAANSGFHIANVLVNGGSVGAVTNYTFTNVTSNHTISASFAQDTVQVTVQTLPAGRTIRVDGGAPLITPQVFDWVSGSPHTIATDSIQNGAAGTRYLYQSWSDAGTISHTVSPSSNATYTANFGTQYFLTMAANAGGTVAPPSNWFNAGQSVVITGTPDEGYLFSSWSGIGSGQFTGGANPASVTMNGPITETANFAQPTVNVTIQTIPPGRTFRIDNGGLITNTFTFSFSPGTTHTVSADSIQEPTSSSRFVWTSWSDGGARAHTLVYPGKDTTFTVNFKKQFSLTMNSATGGTTTPASGFFDSAQVVGITAVPNASYSFSGWTGAGTGSYTGPVNPFTVTMNSAITETPGFTLSPIAVRVQSNPPGRTIIVDGTTYTGTQNFVWSATAPHTLATTSPQGDTATRYFYSSWSDGGSQSHSVAPLTDTTFTVNFTTQYFLTTDTGTGFGTVSPASNWFNAGQSVPVSATPDAGYNFAGWTGTGAGSYTGVNNPATVTMNAPVRETATWSAGTIPITVTTAPTGLAITVDGVNYSSPQVFNWTTGSSHTIATDSLQNSGLTGVRNRWNTWNDAGARSHTVAPLSGTTYTATFRTQYLLTMAANPGGTVTPATSWYDSVSNVVITGIPNAGYIFSSWTGTGAPGSGFYTGPANPRTITLGGPVTQTANFVLPPVGVTIRTNPPGRTFRVDGSGLLTNTYTFTYNPGDVPHTVTTDSIQGQTFAARFVWTSWSDGGARSHTIPYPGRDTTIIVNFKKQLFLTMNAGTGGTVLPVSGYFDSAQVVGISATPSGGYSFSGWVGSGPGSYTGPANPGSVTMDSAVTETGTFTLTPVNVNVQTNPPGLEFIVDGTPYTGSQAFVWSATAPHILSTTSPQGDIATRFVFASWSDAGTQTHTVSPIRDTTFTVNFSTQYFLTMDTGTGGGTLAPPSGWFNSAQVVQISAAPGAGYNFGGWTGAGTGSYTGPNNPATVTMTSPIRETASWIAGTIPVTVATSPAGLAIMVDAVSYTSPQTFNWTTGSAHSISADSLQVSGVTGLRYRWTSWNDAGILTHTVSPTSPATFTAAFVSQYLLTMIANPGGTVTPPTGWYDAGSPVDITGIPNTGFSFSSWTGTGAGSYSGTVNPRGITLNGQVTETANFVQNPFQVVVQTAPVGRTFRVSGTNYTTLQTFSISPGTPMSLSIPVNPQSGPAGTQYLWANWSDSGAISHTFTPTSDTVITAAFMTQYFLTMVAGTGGTVAPASGWFDSNAQAPITATPTGGYTFSGWLGSGTGSYSGPNNPSSVTMSAPISESASFTLFPITVRLRSNPPGRTLLVDSVVYVTPQDIIWTSGTSHTISADSIQDGTAGVRHIWTGWNDAKPRTHAVTGLSDTTFTVNFRDQYFLTMTADTGGSVAPASAWKDSGAIVPITATANSGYGFAGWTGAGTGSYTGMLNPSAVTMLSPVSQTANFSVNAINVTVRTNPDGYPVLVDDTLYASPKSFLWPAGSIHTISTDSVQPPSGGTRLAWSSWNDAGARTHSVAPLTDSTFTATLGTQYYLTMNTNPGGTATPPSDWFNTGQTVTITAIPNPGYTFASWSGSGTGSYSGLTNPRIIAMGGPISQTANFNQNTVLVTVQTNLPGRTFRVDGTSYTTINTFSFLPGTSHLFATDSIQPGVNGRRYVWTGWSDAGSRSHNFVAPGRDSTVIVNFGLQYELLTFANPAAGGTIQPTGQTYYDEGDTATVLAISNRGYAFTSWSGNSTDSVNPVSVIMDTAKGLIANFSPAATVLIHTNPPGRTILADGFATVTPDTFSWFLNSTHTIGTITPQDGSTATRYLWSGWSDGGATSHAVTVDRDTTFTANFQIQHYLFIGSAGNGTVQPGEEWHNDSSTVEISATPDSGYGFIEWTGTGPGGYSGFSNPVTLTMSGWAAQVASFGTILPPPSLAGIPNHSVDQPITPRLSWGPYPGATSYIVQVATDTLFSPQSSIVDSSGITDTTILLPILRNIQQYYWRVKARVGADITAFSETRDFTTIGATISVTSPSLNWGTAFTYDIFWTELNLSGNVHVLLSTDGGLTFFMIDSNVSANSSRFRVPETQTPSNFCIIRVTSALNGQFFGDSKTFSILPGALPLIVPVSAVIPFPADPTISTFYRLVSYPGVVDTLVRLNALIPGAHPKDWRMFSDNGRPDNYLAELGPSSSFETGRGFWLLKRNDLAISANMVMPSLDTNNAVYKIRLRSGWNIIANPFDKNASWSSVLALNGLPSTTPLYGYEGNYQQATILVPFRGYYFFNSTNLTELRIAYPFGTTIPAVTARDVAWELRLGYSSDINDDPANFIGVSASAKEGLDEMESHKPPIFMDQGFLSFRRPAWDREYDRFNTDFRPAVGEGQMWEFEVSREHGASGTLRFDGIDRIPPEYEVFLVNGYNSTPVDLRDRAEYSFTSVSTTMPFSILVGTKSYVERQTALEIPKEFGLSQNFPNPFNSTTSISVKLPRDARIRLDVYSVLGQRVATLADGDYSGGVHTFLWEGTDGRGMPVSSGIYLYRLMEGDALLQARKMIIAK